MTHTLTLLRPAYRPRRLGAGHPLAGADGYPADDQPEPSVWRCSCGWLGDGDECDEGKGCPNAGRDRQEEAR